MIPTYAIAPDHMIIQWSPEYAEYLPTISKWDESVPTLNSKAELTYVMFNSVDEALVFAHELEEALNVKMGTGIVAESDIINLELGRAAIPVSSICEVFEMKPIA